MEEVLKAYQQFINGARGDAGARRGEDEWVMKLKGGKEKTIKVTRADWWGHQSSSVKKGAGQPKARMKDRMTRAMKNWEESKESRQKVMDALKLSEEDMKKQHFQMWNAPNLYREELCDAVQALITEGCKITGIRLRSTPDPSEDKELEWSIPKDAPGKDMEYKGQTITLDDQRDRMYALIESFKIGKGDWNYDVAGNEIGEDESRDDYLISSCGEDFDRVNEVYLASRATKRVTGAQTPYDVPSEILDHQKKMADLFEEVWAYMGGEEGYLDGESTDPMKAKTPYHYLKDNEKKS
jgi:hypothetical protein